MEQQSKHFTATAMIRNDKGEFLLHEHPKLGFWLPPGGHIEENEEPQDAVIREVFEETGLMCRIIDCAYPTVTKVRRTDHVYALPVPLAILKEFIIDDKQGNHWHIDMVYLCELITPERKPADEFKWIPFEELAKLNIPNDLLQLASMVNEANLLK
ncbi:NUDIX domain-containing protein [Providencia stuartii]|uniref:NUDIX hydrolase n=1 Tax=Providencia TaxID=586 RepID=UPI0027E81DBA|nr:NUDIX domain-containing protein [Providencia sp. 2023EL-00965]ELR5298672.1 NUDIX domain-containing protein [Providencia stuartii]MDW7587122.1 NUDIX domain-containing protein [Providencia sp. 2023EL-00965]